MNALSGKVALPDFVPVTSELVRVSKVPRRVMAPEDAEWLADELTARLRKPRGTMRLKPVQAWGLYELGTVGGLFGIVTVGGGKCVAGETEVFDIFSGKRRRVDELGVFEVSTMNAQGKLTTSKTLASYSGQKSCVRLVLKDGSSVILSSDHPVYTSCGWVCAGELRQENDLVATARSIPQSRHVTEASDDEVVLAAYLLSDGSVSHGTASFTNADKNILKEVWEVTERLADHKQNLGGGWKSEGVTRVTQPSRAYTFNLAGISWFRRKWGIYGLAKDKRLPAEFWGLPERQLGLFLNRFWACDGWVNERGPAIVLASEQMIDDLKFLLLRLGVHSRKRFKPSKCQGKTFDAWRLVVATHSIETFFAKVGLVFSKEKQSSACLEHHRARERNTNVDVVPLGERDIPRLCDELGYPRRGDNRQRSCPRTTVTKFLASGADQRIGRDKFEKFCRAFGYSGKFSWLATSDVCWEGILRIEDAGVREVFDLSVPGFGNFVGNNIVLHNTLISLLAPVVMKAQRALLIVPAGLVEKTKRDKEVLEQHWQLPLFIRIMSYEWLGREQAGANKETGKKDALDEWMPDLIIMDEVHRAKNIKAAAVARRLKRHLQVNKNVRCVALSGTVTKRSLHDYAHLLSWCLPAQLMPVPLHWNDLNLWAEALDEKKSGVRRVDPGALEILCADEADKALWETDRVLAARRTYRRRLVETPGVVATYETGVDASLVIRGRRVEMGPEIDAAFFNMRKDWETPDGWSIPDAMTFARHARELALGFWYVWDPRPPIEWQQARKAWHKLVREVLKHSRTYDSEKQVRKAVLHSALGLFDEQWHAVVKELATPPKDETKRTLGTEQRLAYSAELCRQVKDPEKHAGVVAMLAWKGIQDTFEPNTVPVWIDAAACQFAADWAKKNAGIIWVEHKCVGERLRDEFGLSYYGRKGLDTNGRFIDDHDKGKSLVASRPANSEGRNLQGWSKNLIMSLLPNGARVEQQIGRTHRPYQLADEVEVEFVVSCEEHLLALDQALNDARYIESSTGAPQKLLLATFDVDEGALRGTGPRWSS